MFQQCCAGSIETPYVYHVGGCYLAARRSARLAGSGLICDVAIGLAVAHHEVEGSSELRDHLFAVHKVHCEIGRPVNDQNLSREKEREKERGKEKKRKRKRKRKERKKEKDKGLLRLQGLSTKKPYIGCHQEGKRKKKEGQ